MFAGSEAVKMATEDRFDITEWFMLIKDREVSCKSNDEMTETKCAAATPPTQFGSEKVRGKVLNLLPG